MSDQGNPQVRNAEAASGTSQTTRDRLHQSKVDFSEQALAEVVRFMKTDNDIIESFRGILQTVEADIKINPDKFYQGIPVGDAEIGGSGDIAGSGLLSGLGDLIKDIIIKDKDLIVRIVEKVFKL